MAQMVKTLHAVQETRVGKNPWRRERLPTAVFLPGNFMDRGLTRSQRVRRDWETFTFRCSLLSCVWLFATSWTVTHQAPLSMGFFPQESWSEMPIPFPGDLPDPGIKPRFRELQVDPLPSETPGKPFKEKECRLKSAKGRGAESRNVPSWSFQLSSPMEGGHTTFFPGNDVWHMHRVSPTRGVHWSLGVQSFYADSHLVDMADFGCVCLQEAELKPRDPHSKSGCHHGPQQYKDTPVRLAIPSI